MAVNIDVGKQNDVSDFLTYASTVYLHDMKHSLAFRAP